MMRVFPGEMWKEFNPVASAKMRYAVSNFGRLISFTDTIEEGLLLNGSSVGGYKYLGFRIRRNGKSVYKHFFIHKLVGENFIPKESDEQTFVLFLDYNKENTHLSNLKWATRKEMREHQKKNPNVIEGLKKTHEKKKGNGHKLTAATVTLIKKKLFDPERKTRMKMIARQFGISEMQLYRIKSGENWGHVNVEGMKTKSN